MKRYFRVEIKITEIKTAKEMPSSISFAVFG